MKIFKAQRAHGGAAFYAYTFTAAADYAMFHLLAASRPVPWVVSCGEVPKLTSEERRRLEQGGSVHIAPTLDDEKKYCTIAAAEGEITMAFDKDSPAGARVWKR